ncbi:TIGR00725 family protein [bacterium]|nr:TIGR00725 family protein [bacterium]
MIVAVIGGNFCSKEIAEMAYQVGKRIAERKHILICGGLAGVMEAACRGAKDGGGWTIGILPGKDKNEANRFVDIPIVTAMSHARNAIIVRTADVLIAVDGKYGTLSEIGLALAIGKKVVGLNTWDIEGVISVGSVDEAMEEIEKV